MSSFGSRGGPRGRRAGLGAPAVGLAAVVGTCAVAWWATARDGARILAEKGRLARVDSASLGVRRGAAHRELRLYSDRGWWVRARWREPVAGAPPYQAVVLIDGQGIGADAIDLLPDDAGTVAVALDYPPGFPEWLTLGEAVRRWPRLRRLALRVPASVLLALDLVAADPRVDTTRIAVIGSSLGVPAAAAAAALDPRVDGVALVYGGADLATLLEANLALEPRPWRALWARLGAWWLAPVEPARYAGRIAPRPVVLVNGLGDPRIPRASVEALYAAAREPRRLVWLPTGHLDPGDRELLRALADTAVRALPFLVRTPVPEPAETQGAEGVPPP